LSGAYNDSLVIYGNHNEDGNIEHYPQFVNESENQYTLNQNSPAIDAGTALFAWEGDTIVN